MMYSLNMFGFELTLLLKHRKIQSLKLRFGQPNQRGSWPFLDRDKTSHNKVRSGQLDLSRRLSNYGQRIIWLCKRKFVQAELHCPDLSIQNFNDYMLYLITFQVHDLYICFLIHKFSFFHSHILSLNLKLFLFQSLSKIFSL